MSTVRPRAEESTMTENDYAERAEAARLMGDTETAAHLDAKAAWVEASEPDSQWFDYRTYREQDPDIDCAVCYSMDQVTSEPTLILEPDDRACGCFVPVRVCQSHAEWITQRFTCPLCGE